MADWAAPLRRSRTLGAGYSGLVAACPAVGGVPGGGMRRIAQEGKEEERRRTEEEGGVFQGAAVCPRAPVLGPG